MVLASIVITSASLSLASHLIAFSRRWRRNGYDCRSLNPFDTGLLPSVGQTYVKRAVPLCKDL